MQFTGVPQVVAPLATGHPLGLPGAPVRTAEETKVQPVKEQSTTDTDQGGEYGADGQPPASFWRSLTGMPDPSSHVAPPSIMQLRITALLEEQAEALLKELRGKALAEGTVRREPAEPVRNAEASTGATQRETDTETEVRPDLPQPKFAAGSNPREATEAQEPSIRSGGRGTSATSEPPTFTAPATRESTVAKAPPLPERQPAVPEKTAERSAPARLSALGSEGTNGAAGPTTGNGADSHGTAPHTPTESMA
ncbi:hypothetical protein [Alloyangia pacifica]|uniref:hypothetical protein n=1 Tax=Alloyangia pacifica TaxID=311180 RepID=UPI001CD3A180|nr:hypothetical protein [Alloyangia pacifica]MCA0998453.1 hypothetical protein [Alloyangia pacifica]